MRDGTVRETVTTDTGVAPVVEPPAIKFDARKKTSTMARITGQ